MKQIVNLEITLPTQVELEVCPGAKTGVLVLHGFSDRGTSARKRLLGLEPVEGATVLTSHGLFPVPKFEETGFKEVYSWYFRDPYTGMEMIPPETAVTGLKQLIQKLALQNLRWIVLGFSQGGFLAPHLVRGGLAIDAVIAVGAMVRTDSYLGLKPFPVYAINGESDEVIDCLEAKSSFESLKSLGFEPEFRALKGLGHTLNDEGRGLVREWIARELSQ
jgi:predicted esterase